MTEQADQGQLALFLKRLSEPEMTREELLTRYATGPERLEEALTDLSESDFDLARAEGKWTIRQIVHHIVDGDDLWKLGIKAALGNSGCTFEKDWYPPDNAWVEMLDYAGRAIEPALTLLKANRRHIVQLLEHLSDGWERYLLLASAHRPEEMKLTVGHMVRLQAEHVLWHVEQIQETRQVHKC